ncbi:hairy-related 4.2-like [Silurus asotus]|uniref:Hairy-related 4.2-like n=1 Tax=Silurus asotus TaxID=30991 RepID=A0AAD5FP29_SILAS|nr:hairy-related 4.2-like [Silurus asotus]
MWMSQGSRWRDEKAYVGEDAQILSIEQLKSLLAPEFLKQQLDSKLENIDILEMTVNFLRRQQRQPPAFSTRLTAVNQCFSK